MKYKELKEKLDELSEEELDKEIAFYSRHYDTLQEFDVHEQIGGDDYGLADFYAKGKTPKLVFCG